MYILSTDKVLVITYSFSPGKLAQSERAYYLVKSLVENGNDVIVLTCKSEMYFDFGSSVKILPDLPSSDLFKNKLFNRILSPIPDGHFLSLFLSSRKIRISNDVDIIISTSPPHSIHYIANYLSSKLKTKLILDLRDAWKDNRLINYGTLIHKFLSDYLYRKYLNNCNLVIANTEDLKTKILGHNINTKVVAIPNGYPRDSFSNTVQLNIMSDSKIKLLYSGGTYGGEAVKVIQNIIDVSCHKNLKIGFLGETINNTNNCFYLGKVNSDEVPSYLLSVDCLVMYLPKSEIGSARVLLKAYGYAKSGKPILYIGPINATYNFLIKYSTVFQIDEEDKNDIDLKLKQLIDYPSFTDSNINASDFSYEHNFEKLFK